MSKRKPRSLIKPGLLYTVKSEIENPTFEIKITLLYKRCSSSRYLVINDPGLSQCF